MIVTLEAKRLERFLKTGRTCPMVIECEQNIPEDQDQLETGDNEVNSPRLMVVKTMGLPELEERNLFCEFVGNVLARELGLFTPAPALITISQEFAAAVNSRAKNERLSINLREGVGVGCEYLHPLRPLTPKPSLTEEEIAQAAAIYAYDLLIQNPDRRGNKPNCAFYKNGLVAFDFELGFSFLLPILRQNREAWRVSQHGINSVHLFRPLLRNKAIEWKPFINQLAVLCQTRLAMALDQLPEKWQDWAAIVQQHFLQASSKLEAFELELQRSLL